jgi:adenylate cyclase
VGSGLIGVTNNEQGRDFLFPIIKNNLQLSYAYYTVGATETYVGFTRFLNGDVAFSYGNELNSYWMDWTPYMNVSSTQVPLDYSAPTYYQLTADAWYNTAVDAGIAQWSAPYIYGSMMANTSALDLSQSIWISSFCPILNFSDPAQPIIGIASADYTLGRIQKFLSTIYTSPNTNVYILESKTGYMLASSNLVDMLYNVSADNPRMELLKSRIPQMNLIAQALTNQYGPLFTNSTIENQAYIIDNKNYYLSTARFQDEYGLDWTIVVLLCIDDYRYIVTTFNTTVLTVVAIVCICSVISGLLFALVLTRPLDTLGKQMDQLRKLENNSQNSEVLHLVPVKKGKKSSFLHELNVLQKHFTKLEKVVQGFSKYVPVEIVRELLESEHSWSLLRPFVEYRNISVLFTDIVSFTSICEALEPHTLMTMMTQYFETVSEVIRKNGGTLDKYIGDSIMAMFNAPSNVHDYEYLSVLTAIEIEQALDVINSEFIRNGLPALRTRVGVHCGQAFVGNSGSSFRLSYTCMGDTVNLASRLESINNHYGTFKLISQVLHEQVQDRIVCRMIDLVAVKGKTQGVRIYEPLTLNYTENEVNWPRVEKLKEFATKHNVAMGYYLAGEFEKSKKLFIEQLNQYPNDKPTMVMVDRCEKYLTEPPVDWDGIHKATSK